MAEEPENMTLRILREMRDEQQSQSAKLDKLIEKVDKIEGWVVHTLGVVGTHELKNAEQDARMSDHNARIEQLFDQLEDAMKDT
ncbi:MAG: hypothetical protein AAGK38_06780 [Pseudomonadota bacterium]